MACVVVVEPGSACDPGPEPFAELSDEMKSQQDSGLLGLYCFSGLESHKSLSQSFLGCCDDSCMCDIARRECLRERERGDRSTENEYLGQDAGPWV